MKNKFTKNLFFVILFLIFFIIFLFSGQNYNLKSITFIITNITILLFLTLNKNILFIKKALVTYSFLVFSILSLETLFYLKNKNDENIIIKTKKDSVKKFYIDYDERSLSQYIYDHNRFNKKIYPVIFPMNFIERQILLDSKKIIPLSGISNKPTVYCNESGFYSTYKSDDYGYNNYNEIWKELNQIQNIVLIGDSYVHGACVNQDDTISNNLNRINEDHRFFNLGMGGNGPLTNYATLKEYGSKLRPIKVFFFFFEGNDYIDLDNELKSKLLSNYLDINFSQNLFENNNEINLAKLKYYKKYYTSNVSKNFIGEIIRIKNLRHKLRLLKKKIINIRTIDSNIQNQRENELNKFKPDYNIYPKNKELFKIIQNSKDIIQGWGGELIFFILPDYGFYFDFKSGKAIKRENYTEIFKILESLNIRYIDFYDYLENNSDIMNYFPLQLPGHYNKAGYEFISKIININLNEISK